MKKPLMLIAALVVLFAGCGKAKEANVNLGVTSASPGASTSAAPGASSAPTATAKAGSSKAAGGSSPSTSKSGGVTTTPKPAAPGRSNPPKDGRYSYRADGIVQQGNTNPQTYSNQTITADDSHSGAIYSSTVQNSQGTTTTKTQWSSTKVTLVSIDIESPSGSFKCAYNPQPTIVKFPIKAETYPQQKLSGSGNACGGTLDISYLRKENVQDATGHTWSTWVVHVKTSTTVKFNGTTTTITSDETRWVSPDLGVEIKSVSDGTQDSAFGKSKSHVTLLLKSHP